MAANVLNALLKEAEKRRKIVEKKSFSYYDL